MNFSEQRGKGWEDYSIFIEMQSIFRAMFWILDFFWWEINTLLDW